MQKNVRLADFIREEIESILQDWEEFAKTILSARKLGKVELRDHAREMLLEIADDLDTYQSGSEQKAKSKGHGQEDGDDSPADDHGTERHSTGFSVMESISEFRALRASVVSHWTKSYPTITGELFRDITRFHEAIDQALTESLEQYSILKEMETRLFGAILLASPDPIYVLDLEGRIAYANKATADQFALKSETIIGKSTFDLGFPVASDFQGDLEKVIADQTTRRGKFVHTFASGQGEWFEYLLAPVLNDEQVTEATVCISRDITEQVLAEEVIWHNAHHDLLTGLPNRRLFMDRLEQDIKHAKRSSQTLAVLFMDLDGFKDVNDTLGHEAGDRLLTEVARRLADCVRDDDTVARLGGDEFTVILTGARQREDVVPVARAIIDALAMPFRIAQVPVRISVSIGIALYPRDASSPAALLEAADKAMYKSKKTESDRMHFCNS